MKPIVAILAGAAVALVCAGLYVGISIWSVGWIKHDNSITVTMPDGTQYKYQLEKK